MSIEKTPARKAADKLGGAQGLADVAGVSVQAAYQWMKGDRPIPAERAPLIEKATGITCEELCPGVPWAMVRGEDAAA